MSDSSKPKPTITQTTRPLPFDQLPWDDFERLCLMLLPRMGFENPQHYGAAGGERGRDIVAHRDGELWYVQCKQVKQCGPKVLLDEIEKVQGLMADEPDLRPAGLLFIASCDVSATARDRASKRCKELSLACEIWGRTDLDACVQPHSDIAATFFGPYVLPSPPKVYHNLPQPDFGTFIGREEELAQVHRILRPYPHSQHALVAIDGVGGIGKSALALAVAHRYLRDYDHLSPEERFEAIVWTSAQPTVLTADGIAPCLRVTRTLGDIYTTISVTLEREDVTRARPEEQNELVRRALTRKRTLLVVDNLEAVDDERVSSFLRDLPVPTKSVVTTRHRIDAAYSVHLTGMPKDDVLALIAQETAKKGVTLGEDEAEELWNRTGGVPLAIVWSVAQMGFGSGVEDVLPRLRQPTEDIPRFCFERAIEHIRGTDAHKLLVALALFATSASREALDLPPESF
jgi:hypothetical protein